MMTVTVLYQTLDLVIIHDPFIDTSDSSTFLMDE